MLVHRYMVDGEEARALQVGQDAERRAAEELARRLASEEAERRATEERERREAAKMQAALAVAVEPAPLQARAKNENGPDGLEQERAPSHGGLPIHGWVRAAAQSRDASSDWPRELVRLREEVQRGQ